MEIKKIVCSLCEENCFLLTDGNTGILVDPGSDGEKILKETEEIEIPYIILTHCHYDHVDSLELIKKIKKSKVISTAECSEFLSDSRLNVSLYFGDPKRIEKSDIILEDGEIFSSPLGEIKCIKTPGHTDCSACFLIEGKLLSGDTLFKLTVGRWDLPTGNEEKLKNSIKNKLYSLDEMIEVFPGHGEKTTIGYEKKHNLFIKAEN